MSNKYKRGDRVPTDVIADGLDELVSVIKDSSRPGRFQNEFDMRFPPELDRDADLVMSEAASRLRSLEKAIKERVISDCIIGDFIRKQESLGPEVEKVLRDNLWDLYGS